LMSPATILQNKQFVMVFPRAVGRVNLGMRVSFGMSALAAFYNDLEIDGDSSR